MNALALPSFRSIQLTECNKCCEGNSITKELSIYTSCAWRNQVCPSGSLHFHSPATSLLRLQPRLLTCAPLAVIGIKLIKSGSTKMICFDDACAVASRAVDVEDRLGSHTRKDHLNSSSGLLRRIVQARSEMCGSQQVQEECLGESLRRASHDGILRGMRMFMRACSVWLTDCAKRIAT